MNLCAAPSGVRVHVREERIDAAEIVERESADHNDAEEDQDHLDRVGLDDRLHAALQRINDRHDAD